MNVAAKGAAQTLIDAVTEARRGSLSHALEHIQEFLDGPCPEHPCPVCGFSGFSLPIAAQLTKERVHP